MWLLISLPHFLTDYIPVPQRTLWYTAHVQRWSSSFSAIFSSLSLVSCVWFTHFLWRPLSVLGSLSWQEVVWVFWLQLIRKLQDLQGLLHESCWWGIEPVIHRACRAGKGDRDAAQDDESRSLSYSFSYSGLSSCVIHIGLLSVLAGAPALIATSFSCPRPLAPVFAFLLCPPFSLLRTRCALTAPSNARSPSGPMMPFEIHFDKDNICTPTECLSSRCYTWHIV